jgi:hypothetical protein
MQVVNVRQGQKRTCGNVRCQGATRTSGKMPNLIRCRLQTRSKESNRQSAQMVGLLETVNRCGNAFHSRLQLEGQKLGVVA